MGFMKSFLDLRIQCILIRKLFIIVFPSAGFQQSFHETSVDEKWPKGWTWCHYCKYNKTNYVKRTVIYKDYL